MSAETDTLDNDADWAEASTGAATVEDRVLRAAMICTERDGFDRVMVDDIVRESGVPRTTVYRRFGSREMILQAMIVRLSQPTFHRMTEIAGGPGNLRERLEAMLVEGITSMTQYAWARQLHSRGIAETDWPLFASLSEASRGSALSMLLDQARTAGKLRTVISPEDMRRWMLREFIAIAFEHSAGPDSVRTAVRQFMLPVLLPDPLPADTHLAERMGRIDAALAELRDGLNALRASAALRD